MLSPMVSQRSIFTPATSVERQRNFDDYLAFTLGRDGDILEAERDLVRRRERLAAFRANPVRARRPLPRPELFHRNHATEREKMLAGALYDPLAPDLVYQSS